MVFKLQGVFQSSVSEQSRKINFLVFFILTIRTRQEFAVEDDPKTYFYTNSIKFVGVIFFINKFKIDFWGIFCPKQGLVFQIFTNMYLMFTQLVLYISFFFICL